MCSQRWARLDNFPPNVRFGTPKTNFSDFTKWKAKKKKKKKKKEKVLCSIHTFPLPVLSFSPPLLQFPIFSSPFSLLSLSLFSLSSSFSLFLPLFLLSPFLPKFPPNFPRVGESPTLPTLSYATDFNATSFAWIWQRSGVIVFWWKIYH